MSGDMGKFAERSVIVLRTHLVNHGSGDLSCICLDTANVLAAPREKHSDGQRALEAPRGLRLGGDVRT